MIYKINYVKIYFMMTVVTDSSFREAFKSSNRQAILSYIESGLSIESRGGALVFAAHNSDAQIFNKVLEGNDPNKGAFRSIDRYTAIRKFAENRLPDFVIRLLPKNICEDSRLFVLESQPVIHNKNEAINNFLAARSLGEKINQDFSRYEGGRVSVAAMFCLCSILDWTPPSKQKGLSASAASLERSYSVLSEEKRKIVDVLYSLFHQTTYPDAGFFEEKLRQLKPVNPMNLKGLSPSFPQISGSCYWKSLGFCLKNCLNTEDFYIVSGGYRKPDEAAGHVVSILIFKGEDESYWGLNCNLGQGSKFHQQNESNGKIYPDILFFHNTEQIVLFLEKLRLRFSSEDLFNERMYSANPYRVSHHSFGKELGSMNKQILNALQGVSPEEKNPIFVQMRQAQKTITAAIASEDPEGKKIVDREGELLMQKKEIYRVLQDEQSST
ncbi:MAG: hypothetical protein ACOYK9_04565 [Chlamydiia bacterium]